MVPPRIAVGADWPIGTAGIHPGFTREGWEGFWVVTFWGSISVVSPFVVCQQTRLGPQACWGGNEMPAPVVTSGWVLAILSDNAASHWLVALLDTRQSPNYREFALKTPPQALFFFEGCRALLLLFLHDEWLVWWYFLWLSALCVCFVPWPDRKYKSGYQVWLPRVGSCILCTLMCSTGRYEVPLELLLFNFNCLIRVICLIRVVWQHWEVWCTFRASVVFHY